jgi:hypothetical protein
LENVEYGGNKCWVQTYASEKKTEKNDIELLNEATRDTEWDA